jgi:DUF4097 and DUF4098 domain-containing protein YvlB
MVYRSVATAAFIAVAIQIFAVGILAPKLPREVCRPGAQQQQSMKFAAVPVIRLTNTDGTVHVIVAEVKEIQVDADIMAYTPSTAEQPVAEQYIKTLIKTKVSDAAVEVVTEPGERPDELDLRVNYVITVPEGTDVALEVSNGNVRVGPGCNQVTVEGVNSDIDIQGPKGAVNAKSTNGRIRIYEAEAETTLETVNGNINAQVKSGTLQASTITGSIMTTLLSPGVSACDLTSMNGAITLIMSENCSAEVSATTGRGTVRAEPGVELKSGEYKRHAMLGVIGDGATKLSMNSMNGDIVLQRSTT